MRYYSQNFIRPIFPDFLRPFSFQKRLYLPSRQASAANISECDLTLILLLYRLNLNNGACANSTPAVVKPRDRFARNFFENLHSIFHRSESFAPMYFPTIFNSNIFFLFSSFFSCSIYNFTRLSNASCAKAGITGSFGNSRRGLKRIPNRWRLDPTAVTRYSLRLYLRDYLHEQTRTSA